VEKYISHIVLMGYRDISTCAKIWKVDSLSREQEVLPGTLLGAIEEYFPGSNVYEIDGKIYSSIIGIPRLDMVRRIVWVEPRTRVQMPSQGSMVYAYVINARDESAFLRIIGSDPRSPIRQSLVGMLHISQARLDPGERSLLDIIRPGDLVYAKILSKSNPYILTLRAPKAGVVLSLCLKCAAFMRYRSGKLSCPRCGFEESRRVSQLYISI